MEFQTRNAVGNTHLHKTFTLAYNSYLKDPSIWKISWDSNNRWRPKYKSDTWQPESEAKLNLLSGEYKTAPANQLFWVCQLALPKNIKEILDDTTLTEEEREVIISVESITDVLTEEQFYEKHKDL